MVRDGLKALLANEVDFEVIGEADNGRECLQMIPLLKPDVILIDVSMPGLNGIEATRQIHELYPDVKIVGLSIYAHEEYIFQVFEAGALGYVLKQAEFTEMIEAIRVVLHGGHFFGTAISKESMNNYLARVRGKEKGLTLALSAREREVLQLLVEGLSNKEIAAQLIISVKTVETHRSNIMHKLNLKDKTDLVRYALRRGWATLS